MLLRNGKVVAEGSWEPYRKEDPHTLFSVSKSFTSAAIGMAIEEGLLKLEDQVISFFPEKLPENPSENLKAMRIRDLLTMTSGHDDDTIMKLFNNKEKGMTEVFLALPVAFKPGTHFQYNTGATYMLSAILQKATGQSLYDYLKPRLFDPLGFKNSRWQVSPEGVNFGGLGLFATIEDLTKFGQLYLQNGVWNGKQLVPEDWVRESTSRQVLNGSNPDANGEQGYGYQFWRNRNVGYRADGAFGQTCFVLPEHNMVLAVTGGSADPDKIVNQVWEYLLPALSSKAVPEDSRSFQKLQNRISDLKVTPLKGKKPPAYVKKLSGKVFDMEDNELGLQTLSFDFKSGNSFILLKTTEGDFEIPFVYEKWKRAETGFMRLYAVILNRDSTPIATSAAWLSEDTMEMMIRYHHTQLRTRLRFRFAGKLVLLDIEQNVSFGPPRLPRMLGEIK